MIMKIDKAKAIKKAEIDYAHEEGMDKGKIEGKLEGKMEVAANLLKRGMTPEQIGEGTGLSIEQINKLKKEQG